MSPGTLALIELFLVFGVVIGIAAWELVGLRRAERREAERRADPGPREP